MKYICRELSERVIRKLLPNKVIIGTGARRVGKTMMINHILNTENEPFVMMNGKDINVHDKLAHRTVENYKQLLGSNRLLFIDEAQKIQLSSILIF